MSENNTDREVEREPLDVKAILAQLQDEFAAMQPRVPVPAFSPQGLALSKVVWCGSEFAKAIVQALPEGKEKEIALNGIVSAILWTKHGLLRRGVVSIVAAQDEKT